MLGATGVASFPGGAQQISEVEIAKGPFQGDGDSLDAYTCPQWFRGL